MSSLRSASQPLLIDVAQIHRTAAIETTAAHGRGGTDGGRLESIARFRPFVLPARRRKHIDMFSWAGRFDWRCIWI